MYSAKNMTITYPPILSNCDIDVAKGNGYSVRRIADDIDSVVKSHDTFVLHCLSTDKEVSWM